MTNNYHTPPADGSPANMSIIRAPLGELDEAISNLALTEKDGHIIQDEGVDLAQQQRLNFVGAGVAVTDAVGKTVVTIPGGVTDHGALGGLTDADHVAGSIAFTATDKLLGRFTAGAGVGEEIALTAAGRALIDDADAAAQRVTLGLSNMAPMDARLTLETGVAISTTDQTAKTTIYLTPYRGNRVAIYSGTAWYTLLLSADISLSLSGYTAGKNYDIWVYDNAGSLALASTVWTNDTTRATALVLQNGVYVKSGATSYRYVGTIRITATTGQCEDSVTKRYLWNYYNRVNKKLYVTDATASWTYQTATWRSANNSTANRVEVVIGVAEDPVNIRVLVSATQTNAAYRAAGIGLDKTNGNDALASYFSNGVGGSSLSSTYYDVTSVGYHYFQWVEQGEAVGTCTWYSNVIGTHAGIVGDIHG